VVPQASLPDDVVVVRWLSLDTIGAWDWSDLLGLLDLSERTRAARFHFERDCHAFVAAHALTRRMLSVHARPAGQPPHAWRFVSGPHGKPEIDDASRVPPLRFNLSHTRGLVAVAVTRRNDVGLDVEQVDASRLGIDLAATIFTPTETEQILRLPPESQASASFAIWTLKEAYIKAVGLGLSCPLDAFDVVLDPLSIRFSSRIVDDPSQWLLKHMSPVAGHALALAVRHGRPAAVLVDARATTVAELV
jgi:4'-phosphopantetheinyl transferase